MLAPRAIGIGPVAMDVDDGAGRRAIVVRGDPDVDGTRARLDAPVRAARDGVLFLFEATFAVVFNDLARADFCRRDAGGRRRRWRFLDNRRARG